MDKKSIIGIVLIFAILVVFSIINQPSKEEIEIAKHKRDSIAQVEAEKEILFKQQLEQTVEREALTATDSINPEKQIQERTDQFGVFGAATIGTEEFYTLENNLMKITFSNKGGRIYTVELKNYQTHDSLPLLLFDGPDTQFGLNFFAQNRSIQTSQFYFTPVNNRKETIATGPEVKKGSEGKIKFNSQNPGGKESVTFRLEVAPGSFMEYVYTLEYNSFLVNFDLKMQGMNKYIAANQSYLNFNLSYDVPRQERISQFGEDTYTNMTYKFFEDEVDNLSKSKSDEENLNTRLKWIGFKQLFFNSTIIANESFANAQIKQTKFEENPNYLANFYADISLPYEGEENQTVGMQFFFGPNHYQTLKQYDIDLESNVYLGYPVVKEVNRFIIIPIFNFLRNFIDNFGLIILLLTIFIKTVLFPFTYKSYMSQAKMRVLKPEIDELSAKFGP
ncbi:MAG: membrane protein insertase YidC, partial [Draconibacterium sp.]|nr:membrane protein insertase YidC [Draconibacterium sp.]